MDMRKKVVCPKGENGLSFIATVEDDDFLEKVKNGLIQFRNGTTLRAIVRTIQKKGIRTRIDRSIVEVKAVVN